MSKKAYKVLRIETCVNPTFNLTHDPWVAETLNLYSQLNDDGCGLACVAKWQVEEVLKELEADPPSKENKENQDILKAILADMGEHDSVDYLCG